MEFFLNTEKKEKKKMKIWPFNETFISCTKCLQVCRWHFGFFKTFHLLRMKPPGSITFITSAVHIHYWFAHIDYSYSSLYKYNNFIALVISAE